MELDRSFELLAPGPLELPTHQMPIPPVEVVRLSDLKIAGLKINPNQTANEVCISASNFGCFTQLTAFLRPSTGATTQSLLPGPIEGTVPAAARPKPYERLAADKPGEELAPDAGIWQLYVEEATEHDTELVKVKNANLDVMLLFAALFSAILTAFLIESKNLLQEDSGELTVALLLAIAQSQQRIEQNNSQILPFVEHPKFSPPASARWINGLWFTALSLSLAAALIAMLAKEWLITFTSSRSRSARAYAHLHQQQLQGMKKWRALHIMDLLPSMLHLSLLLFSLGFAVYLWTLDTAIAIAGVVVSATALIFYVTTVVMGAVYESCPFKTQISKYMHTTLRLFRLGRLGSSRPPSGREIDTPTDLLEKDLPALLWLTDYASDPAVSDCACQALAGLSAFDISALAVTSDEILSAIVEPTSIIRNIKAHGPFGTERLVSRLLELQHKSSPAQNRYILVKSLFDHVCIRLHDSNTRQQRDLKACQGINIARYSGALPMLVQYLETNPEDIPSRDRREIQGANLAFSRPAYFAFTAMDTVWNEDCPELSLEAYALLISADLRLTEVVARIYYSEPDQNSTRSPRRATQISELGGSSTRLINEPISITVDVQHHNNASLREVTSLHELRARYSRTLARASVLISLQNSEFVTISPSSLAYLLESMGVAAQSDILSPLSGFSTAFPQSEATNALPKFCIGINRLNISGSTPPLHFGDEENILPCLMKVLSSPGIEQIHEVEISALRAFSTFGPILVRQWQAGMNQYSIDLSNKDIFHISLSSWSRLSGQESFHRQTAEQTINQLLHMATVALSQVDCQYMPSLAETAVTALCSRASMESGLGWLTLLGDSYPQILERFIQMLNYGSSKISQSARGKCLQLFLNEKLSSGTLLSNQCLTPRSWLDLLHIMADTPGHPSEVLSILAGLKPFLPLHDGEEVSYISGFIRQIDGFEALVKITAISEYTAAAIDFISKILEAAVSRSALYSNYENEQLASHAIPGLLSAVQLVLHNTTSDEQDFQLLVSCIRNTITLLNGLDAQELDHIALRSDTESVSEKLKTVCGTYTEPPKILVELLVEWDKLLGDLAVAEEHAARGVESDERESSIYA